MYYYSNESNTITPFVFDKNTSFNMGCIFVGIYIFIRFAAEASVFCAQLRLRIFYLRAFMFEDVEHIQRMSYSEYKQAIYYLNHPSEYDGDFAVFRDKLIEYASLDPGERLIMYYDTKFNHKERS